MTLDRNAAPRSGTDAPETERENRTMTLDPDNHVPLYSDERVAVFIDGANLFNATRSLGFDIDYKKLLRLFSEKGRLVRAFYYTALMEDQEYSPIRPLVDWLDYNGYTMVTKRAKEFTDSLGRRKVKGNMDIELAIDVMDMAAHVDHIVLLSGDGDFRRLVEAVQRKGVRASVVSTNRTQPSMVADELRRQADNFIELEDLKQLIMRDPTIRQQREAAWRAYREERGENGDDSYRHETAPEPAFESPPRA